MAEPSVVDELKNALQEAYNNGFRDGKESALSELRMALVNIQGTTDPELDRPISVLNLPERPRFILKRYEISTLRELVDKSEDDLLNLTNFGAKSLDLVTKALSERGLKLKER